LWASKLISTLIFDANLAEELLLFGDLIGEEGFGVVNIYNKVRSFPFIDD